MIFILSFRVVLQKTMIPKVPSVQVKLSHSGSGKRCVLVQGVTRYNTIAPSQSAKNPQTDHVSFHDLMMIPDGSVYTCRECTRVHSSVIAKAMFISKGNVFDRAWEGYWDIGYR